MRWFCHNSLNKVVKSAPPESTPICCCRTILINCTVACSVCNEFSVLIILWFCLFVLVSLCKSIIILRASLSDVSIVPCLFFSDSLQKIGAREPGICCSNSLVVQMYAYAPRREL